MAEVGGVLQQRRGFLRMAGLAAMALLAACQPSAQRRPVAPPPPPKVETPAAAVLPQDEARHRIALLVPLSGPNAAFGQSIANAANLALIDTNNKSLRMTVYDTAPGAAAAAGKAIADGAGLFLGPAFAADVRAIAPIAAKANVPILSFSNDREVAGPGIYVLGYAPEQAIRRVVEYARSKGAVRFVGLMPAGVYGRNASTSLIRAVEASGGKLVAMKSFDRSPASLARAVASIGIEQPFDAVLIADGGRLAVAAAPLVRASGSPEARLLGTELWNADEIVAAAPAALHGAWYASVADGLYNQLSAKYRARFGITPFRLSSLGYDAVLLATRIARDWNVGTPFPKARLADAGGFVGIDGAFRFGPDNVAERALEVVEVGPGGGTTVSAAPKSFD